MDKFTKKKVFLLFSDWTRREIVAAGCLRDAQVNRYVIIPEVLSMLLWSSPLVSNWPNICMVWSCAFQGSPKASWKRCKKHKSQSTSWHTPKSQQLLVPSKDWTSSHTKIFNINLKQIKNLVSCYLY